MISGTTTTLLAALISGATPASPPDIPPETAALIASLGRPVPADTTYTEVRFVGMLKQPLVLRGQLHYGGAGQLGKRIDSPYKETTTIAGGEVDVVREGRSTRHFSLQRAPELEVLLGSFSALLGGDAAGLAQNYSLTLKNDASNWRLTLQPRSSSLARHLREIVVDGAGNEPRCFTLHQVDGDGSVMLLGALADEKLPQSPTPAALDSVCGNRK